MKKIISLLTTISLFPLDKTRHAGKTNEGKKKIGFLDIKTRPYLGLLRGSLLTVFIFFSLGCTFFAYAEKEATDTGKTNSRLQKIQELKEKVAEKVNQLQGEKLGVFNGEIIKIENEGLLVRDETKELEIQTSNATKFIWINTDGKKLVLSLNDFVKGDRITVWGKYNKEAEVITADVVSGRIYPQVFFCQTLINDLNKSILSCQSKNGTEEYDLSIPQNAKIFLWQEDEGITKTTLEGIKMGTPLLVKGVKKVKNSAKITPLLIIVLSLTTPTGFPQ